MCLFVRPCLNGRSRARAPGPTLVRDPGRKKEECAGRRGFAGRELQGMAGSVICSSQQKFGKIAVEEMGYAKENWLDA